MRNMSFSLTTRQFLDGTKTVTRRLGWRFLNVGDHVMAVEKGMGLKKGEKVKRLGEIEIVAVGREHLRAITRLDVWREGFGPAENDAGIRMRGLTPGEFIGMFCREMKCPQDTIVTRIKFKRLAAQTAARSTP